MEPLQVQAILFPYADGDNPASIEAAFAALEAWAAERSISILDPIARDPETLRFAVIYAEDGAMAQRILDELADADFIDGLYLKPGDHLP